MDYSTIRTLHIAAVALSGTLFFLRGLGLMRGGYWPRWGVVKVTTYIVDTVLLVAALLLMVLIKQYPFVNAWLTVKVVLLLVYIGLGVMALHPRRQSRSRCLLWLAALLVYGYIVSVARAHHPLGLFYLL